LALNHSLFRNPWLLFSWALFILILHIIPSEKIPQPPDWNISFDKVVHFILFAVFSFLLLCVTSQRKSNNAYNLLIIVVLALIYGLLMEAVQLMVPRREFHLLDIIADSLGVLAGFMFFQGYMKQQNSR